MSDIAYDWEWNGQSLLDYKIKVCVCVCMYVRVRVRVRVWVSEWVSEWVSVSVRVCVLSLIHISEPTRLGMISYAVFCLKKKKKYTVQI